MFTMRPIGHVRSPYKDAREVPKGLGAKHEAEGVLEILPEFEVGLTDIEGFSHLYVIWVFHRSQGLELLSTPAERRSAPWRVRDPIPETPEPYWSQRRRTLSPRGKRVARVWTGYA